MGKTKIKDWLISLNQMKASDELDATQVRQLLFDLERYFYIRLMPLILFDIPLIKFGFFTSSAYAEFQHSLTV